LTITVPIAGLRSTFAGSGFAVALRLRIAETIKIAFAWRAARRQFLEGAKLADLPAGRRVKYSRMQMPPMVRFLTSVYV
jgi:hypothetical protein